MKREGQVDGSQNVALNGIRVADQTTADALKVPVGEVVPWAKAFPSTGRHL